MSTARHEQSLSRFLRSGELPFAGRDQLIDDLATAWRSAPADPGCRVELLVGEAGSGKSRLLAELERRTRAEGALVLRLALGREPEGDPLAALGEALGRTRELHQLGLAHRLGVEPAALADALARLARLRPLLLCIDGCERLDHAGQQALAGLLERVDGEPLPVVAAGRPSLLGLRAQLEPRLVAEHRLGPLPPEALAQIWEELQGRPAVSGLLERLYHESEGLPAALRYGLRALLSPVAGGPAPPSLVDLDGISERLREAFEQLLEGRLAHLAASERRTLEQVAFLGSTTARESLEAAMGNGSSRAIDRLVATGALAVASGVPVRLSGPPSAWPVLECTDDWAQRRLARRSRPREAALLAILRGQLPVYSPQPWRHLAQLSPAALDATALEELSLRAAAAATRYERGPDPETGRRIARDTEAWLRQASGGSRRSGPAWALARCRVLAAELFLAKGSVTESEFRERAELLIELAAGDSAPQAEMRLQGLLQLNRHLQRIGDAREANTVARRIEGLVQAHPELRRSRGWLIYLGDQGLMAWGRRRGGLARRIERHLRALLAEPDLDARFREEAELRVAATLVPFFDVPEQEDERRQLLEDLERRSHPADAVLPAIRLDFLLETGRLDGFAAAWEPALRLWTRRRLKGNLYVAWSWKLCMRALSGDSPSVLEGDRRQMAALRGFDPDSTAHLAQCSRYLETCILLGRRDWVKEILARRSDPGQPLVWPLSWVQLLIELRSGAAGSAWKSWLATVPGDESPRLTELIKRLQALAAGPLEVDEVARLRRWLARPPARLSHLGQLLALSDALAAHPHGQLLTAEMAAAWEQAWIWCEQRQLGVLLQGLLEDRSAALSPSRRRTWQRRARQMPRPENDEVPSGSRSSPSGSPRLQLTALDELAFRTAGGAVEVFRPRGQRLRTLTGLLVADRMLRTALERREFGLIAAGVEDDGPSSRPDRVRNILGIAVHRLREALGHDAVLTGSDTPRLNLDAVEVDLLGAHEALQRAEQDLRDSRPLAARRALERVLDATLGAVLLPGLYHAFFESVRDDFASRRRRAVLELGAALLREGDREASTALLQRVWQAEPDDEDVAKRLAEQLTQDGRGAEAAAVLHAFERARRG
jgi:hypothetical protein